MHSLLFGEYTTNDFEQKCRYAHMSTDTRKRSGVVTTDAFFLRINSE